MKILVTKFRNLGDVLLSTPVFASLKAIYPESEVHVSVNDFCVQIVEDNPNVDRVIPYQRSKNKKQGLLGRIGNEFKFYRQFIGQYDLVINLTEGDRGCIISALSGASRRLGYVNKPTLINKLARFDTSFDSRERIHTVQKDLQFIEAIDSSKVDRKVTLGYKSEHKNEVETLLRELGLEKEFIVVHPVSRWMYKCWDASKVAQCIDHLQQKWQKPILLTTSADPKEVSMAQEILAFCKSKPLLLPKQIDLQAYACLVSKACLFFGIDSAPMHIAASTDTPVVALFGGSTPDLWGPWDNSEGSNYQEITGIQHNGLHTVISNNNMEIYYDGDRKLSRGMMAIKVDTVISQLDISMSRATEDQGLTELI
ncbi:putative lipopolysaccharide heptosyltransferase III [Endozoicomonas sp. ALB115]|uniref:putative lipopolysaccharide heptosyltransferase III n=1 Tax=Endozoicomonas sp. ALB115 TaxID=3403074 RepID=UPI003BB4A384